MASVRLVLIPAAVLLLAGCASGHGRNSMFVGEYASQPAALYSSSTEPVIRDAQGNVLAVGVVDVDKFVRGNTGFYKNNPAQWDQVYRY